MGSYKAFERQCVRNLLAGTALSVVPAGVYYLSTLPLTAWQLGMLAILGVLDLAALLPLDVAVLKWTLRPVRQALAADGDEPQLAAGYARLLDSPRLVLLRVYGPHAVAASAGITALILLANRQLGLGVPTQFFPFYWLLNLTVVPVAHAVYEFAAMERALQPPARELAARLGSHRPEVRGFPLESRMRVFFPLLAFAPIAVIVFAVYAHMQAYGTWTGLTWKLAAIGGTSAVLFLFLMYTLGSQFRTHTRLLTDALDRLGRGELRTRAELFTTNELGELATHVNTMAAGLTERQRLRDLFGAYMTDEVATALLAKGDHAEERTEKRFVAILFVDVRGFTAFSRDRAPEVVVSVLNKLFEATVDAIAAEHGTVNKYLGDGLLAVFGAPVILENPCAAALAAAVAMSHRLRGLNHLFAATGVPPMKIGIGIHAGTVVVGSIGSEKHKLEYTVIGDPVNVASRIEQLNKELGTEILVSEEALQAAGEAWRLAAAKPTSQRVKGIEDAVTVYPIDAAAATKAR